MKTPALLSFNPELQRGLWLELTPTRLIATPIVIALVIGGFYAEVGSPLATKTAIAAMWILLVLWGARLAAESLGDEIAGRTWDVQRLSAQSAWGLTLGKLCGGTAYAWYGAAICGLALILIQPPDLWASLGSAVIGGLSAQCAAFFVMLALQRFETHGRRTHTTFAQIAGIIMAWRGTAFPFLTYSTTARVQAAPGTHTDAITWYGLTLDSSDVAVALQLLAVAWMIFGAMRIVRRELGFVDGPLGWTLLSVFMVVLTAGVVSPEDSGDWRGQPTVMRLLGAHSLTWFTAEILTYVAVLGTPVSRIGLLQLSGAFKARDWRGVWRNLPVWVPSAAAGVLGGLVPTVRIVASHLGGEPLQSTFLGPAPLLVLGFMMRDIALIYLLRVTYRGPTVAALLVLFLFLYAAPVPILLHGDKGLLLLFVADPRSTIIGWIIPWAEAALAWFALWRLLRRPRTAPAG